MKKKERAKEFEFSEQPHEVERMPLIPGHTAWEVACASAREGVKWLEENHEHDRRKLLLSLIENLMDNLDRNLDGASVNEGNREAQRWLKRLQRERRRLEELLAAERVVPFDPSSAPPGLATVEGEEERDDVPDGAVVSVLLRGWLWKGELLRKASVIVAKNTGKGHTQTPGPDAKEWEDAEDDRN